MNSSVTGPNPFETDIARLAAEDAANRQMRKAGRERWNEDDWNLACAEFERLNTPTPRL